MCFHRSRKTGLGEVGVIKASKKQETSLYNEREDYDSLGEGASQA